MAWFRRKPRGKHALGAAVTSIPSRPLTVVDVTPNPVAPAAPAPAGAVAQVLPAGQAVRPEPPERPPAGPRVQLGFRDGTSTALDPTSSQSLALEELAQSLTRRD